jgi:transposase-like protein
MVELQTGKKNTSIAGYETLETMVRDKIKGFIEDILDEEVTSLLGRKSYERFRDKIDVSTGKRNGYGRPRRLSLMSGTVTIRRPRIRGLEERFESKVLPLFKRRSKEIGEMLPELYLHGLSSGDFELALRGLLGEGAPLSASSIDRLKAKWKLEYDEWKTQDLSSVKAVYQWADGLYVKAGFEKEKAALLTIICADTDGKKRFLAVESGYRESAESWADILRDLKKRGLKFAKLTVADGALGLWAALRDLNPEGDEQRCWNHRIVNILDAIPKNLQTEAKELLTDMPYADTQGECEKLRDGFIKRYKKSCPKATDKIMVDWERMVAFYNYPKEHWRHLRTSNIVESPFASIRLRTNASKRYKKIENATAMIWKLMQVAEKSFNRLNAWELMPAVYEGKKFQDGMAVVEIGRSAA